ncbi:MAG: hypothetical protein L3J21_03250 [Devosiaceae bacterium]|nr:hypothetical protein [Devosiaceae bacterium]
MTKYAPLETHLLSKRNKCIQMQFSDIEAIIDDHLPPSARKHRAWWSNNPSNSVITYAWLEAGYKTSEVDLDGEKLIFRRVKKTTDADGNGDNDQSKKRFRSPIFGCMAGTVTIPDDVDITEPAMPEWAEMIEEKYGKDGSDFT